MSRKHGDNFVEIFLKYSALLQTITILDNDIVKLIDGMREVARKYGFEPKF